MTKILRQVDFMLKNNKKYKSEEAKQMFLKKYFRYSSRLLKEIDDNDEKDEVVESKVIKTYKVNNVTDDAHITKLNLYYKDGDEYITILSSTDVPENIDVISAEVKTSKKYELYKILVNGNEIVFDVNDIMINVDVIDGVMNIEFISKAKPVVNDK